MKNVALTLLFLGTALAATPASGGAPVNRQCCACLVDGPPNLPALFCSDLITELSERIEFENQCSDVSGITSCLEIVPSSQSLTSEDDVNCAALLGNLPEGGIVCPGSGSAPVPVLGTAMLAGLAIALAGLGAWMVRRRIIGA
jgi:hypothetical protein